MLHYRDILRLLRLRTGPKQHKACRYLETHGLKFCVDFGLDNAVDIAKEHWRNRRRRKAGR